MTKIDNEIEKVKKEIKRSLEKLRVFGDKKNWNRYQAEQLRLEEKRKILETLQFCKSIMDEQEKERKIEAHTKVSMDA